MQDAFAYCAELVRAGDRDRYLASLFAPAERRGALHALYAFNIEIARVREVARQPLAGEIRLQWWSEALRGERNSEVAANPVASALLETIARHRLAVTKLIELVETRRFDLYDEPMMRLAELEDYARKTSSALFALAAKIVAGADADAVAVPAGIAYGVTAMLQALSLYAARRQAYLPVELLERHHVQIADVFARRSSAGLDGALGELRDLAHDRLVYVRDHLRDIPAAALVAFLSVALVRPSLNRLARSDAFAPAELSLWRRQWLLWRAAHNPTRIAG
jgi:15-cis-phytoene synthase